MQKYVFISYQHEDGDFAQILIYKIQEAGFEIWVDSDRLHAGEDWRTGIDAAIKNAIALIVIMTPEAKTSEYVTYEWAFAWAQESRSFLFCTKKQRFTPVLKPFTI